MTQPAAKQQPLATPQVNESADRRDFESITGNANMAKSYPTEQSTSSNAPSNRMVGIGSGNRHVHFNDTLNMVKSYLSLDSNSIEFNFDVISDASLSNSTRIGTAKHSPRRLK